MKTLQKIWEYFFAPWEITIHKRGTQKYTDYTFYSYESVDFPNIYYREYVEYKYVHKFRKEEKIVKEYLN